MRLILFSFVVIILFASCDEQKNIAAGSYFDTKGFFEKEVARLKQQSLVLEKEMTFDGATDHKKIAAVNWEKELAPFLAVDLLKSSYNGRFTKDSVNLGQQYSISYFCNEKKTDLKKAEIVFDTRSQKITSVILLLTDSNTLYGSEKLLRYYTDSAFSVEGLQQVKLTEGIRYRMTASLVKP